MRQLQEEKIDYQYFPTFNNNFSYIEEHPKALILISDSLEDGDVLEVLRSHSKTLKNRCIVIHEKKEMQYLRECLNAGALNFFSGEFSPNEIKYLVSSFFASREEQAKLPKLELWIQREQKELVLGNLDIYERYKINFILDYLTTSLKIILPQDEYLGIVNGLYEMLVNAMEHGNLAIPGSLKEEKLLNGDYDAFLAAKVYSTPGKISLSYTLESGRFRFEIEDQGHGFNVKEHVRFNHETRLLSGRGIQIASHYFDQVVYNNQGNRVTLIKELQEVDT